LQNGASGLSINLDNDNIWTGITTLGDGDVEDVIVNTTDWSVDAAGTLRAPEIRTSAGTTSSMVIGESLGTAYVNVWNAGQPVMEIGKGTDGSSNPAGYGIQINNDAGAARGGIGFEGGTWAVGVGDFAVGTGVKLNYLDNTADQNRILVANAGVPAFTVDREGDLYTGGSMTFEGATVNANKTTIGVIEPMAVNAINFPDASGTVLLDGTINSFAWRLLGNSGTTAGTHFIGTTDVVPLEIRVNNARSGYISPSSNNTSFGYQAALNGVGDNNTAFGTQALQSNTSGETNTAIGSGALNGNLGGDYNTALGAGALYSNTEGNRNIGLGTNAGRFIADGTTANATSSSSIYIGSATKASADGRDNEIVIGYNTTGNGSNSVTLGNSLVDLLFSMGATAPTALAPNMYVDGATGQIMMSSNPALISSAIGTTVQAYDNDLSDIAALTPTAGNIIIGNGTDWTTSTVALTMADLTATNTTLTFSAAYDGSSAQTVGINLDNDNIWTGATTLGNGDGEDVIVNTTDWSVDASGNANFVGTLNAGNNVIFTDTETTTLAADYSTFKVNTTLADANNYDVMGEYVKVNAGATSDAQDIRAYLGEATGKALHVMGISATGTNTKTYATLDGTTPEAAGGVFWGNATSGQTQRAYGVYAAAGLSNAGDNVGAQFLAGSATNSNIGLVAAVNVPEATLKTAVSTLNDDFAAYFYGNTRTTGNTTLGGKLNLSYYSGTDASTVATVINYTGADGTITSAELHAGTNGEVMYFVNATSGAIDVCGRNIPVGHMITLIHAGSVWLASFENP
jgi:hypothetical protein